MIETAWRLAKVRSSKIPTAEMRSKGKCELFCQVCFDRNDGYLLFDKKLNRKVRFIGWGGHTYQKCWAFGKMSEEDGKSYIMEVQGGKAPNPEWGKEPERLKKQKHDAMMSRIVAAAAIALQIGDSGYNRRWFRR